METIPALGQHLSSFSDHGVYALAGIRFSNCSFQRKKSQKIIRPYQFGVKNGSNGVMAKSYAIGEELSKEISMICILISSKLKERILGDVAFSYELVLGI